MAEFSLSTLKKKTGGDMGLFDPMWKRIHKKVVKMYEEIAMAEICKNPNNPSVDMFKIISKIFLSYQPHLKEEQALYWVIKEYENFKNFDTYNVLSKSIKKRNPNVPEEVIMEMFNLVKKKFIQNEYEHASFLFFIISKFIEIEKSEVERGEYLLEIASGNIPKTDGLFRRTKQIALYKLAKDLAKNTESFRWSLLVIEKSGSLFAETHSDAVLQLITLVSPNLLVYKLKPEFSLKLRFNTQKSLITLKKENINKNSALWTPVYREKIDEIDTENHYFNIERKNAKISFFDSRGNILNEDDVYKTIFENYSPLPKHLKDILKEHDQSNSF